MKFLKGLDASSVQGKLSFDKLSLDYRFVILKSAQGNDGFDPCFAPNMRAALEEGVEPFAYAFSYPLVHLDPKAQAKLFVDAIHRFPEMVGRPIFLDLEWPAPEQWGHWGCNAKQIASWCEVHCAEVERLSGRTPVLYTYNYWWTCVRNGGGDVSWAANYPLWIASYVTGGKWPTDTQKPVFPTPWTDWLFWQFDGNGGLKLPNGIDSDFCVFKGDEAALERFVKGIPSEPVTLPDFEIVHAMPDGSFDGS